MAALATRHQEAFGPDARPVYATSEGAVHELAQYNGSIHSECTYWATSGFGPMRR